MNERSEKIFWGFIVVGILTFVAGLISELKNPYSLAWWIYLSLTIFFYIAAIVLLLYPRFDTHRLLKKELGIVRVFSNRNKCKQLIKLFFRNSHECRIFILRGLSDFVGKDESLFEQICLEDSQAMVLKKESGFVRVLLCSPQSKFLSPDRLNALKKDHQKSVREIKEVGDHLDEIKKSNNLDYRFYMDGFLCKFYLFDNVGFVVFNDKTTKIDQESPYLQIKKDNSLGLYHALEMYFDFLWNDQSIDSDQMKKESQ